MVTPIHLVSVALGTAFLLGFTKDRNWKISGGLVLLALLLMNLISGSWTYALFFGDQVPVQVFTAGFKPPFSINLQMGRFEAAITLMINFAGLLGAIYLFDRLKKAGRYAFMVYMVFILGLNVAVMTRDLFNLFVFMEITTIATAGLIFLVQTGKAAAAGLKYMIATSIISGVLLIGIIFAYSLVSTLNLDGIIDGGLPLIKGGAMVVFLILIALLLESKPFPANGWGLDVYESAHPGIGAMLSVATGPMIAYVIFKVLPISGGAWNHLIAITGIITFVGSNFLAIKQHNTQRLLGYSSVAQAGILLIAIGLQKELGHTFIYVAAGLLMTNYFAKAGLFWLSGLIKGESLQDWTQLKGRPVLLFLFGLFVFSLAGFPPSPAFFAKWELIMQLASHGGYVWMVFILIGSFFELIYLTRWFGQVIGSKEKSSAQPDLATHRLVPVGIMGVGLLGTMVFFLHHYAPDLAIDFIPIIFIAALFILDFLPAFLKNTVTILAMGWYLLQHISDVQNDTVRLIFFLIFLAGGAISLLAGFSYKGKRIGYYPFVAMTFVGLTGLVTATTTLGFFLSWELMALGSYLLISRGKNAQKTSWIYILFSVGGAYLLLMGFGVSFAVTGDGLLSSLGIAARALPAVGILLTIGFLSKIAAMGLHIWLPGAYAEAEDDATPFIAGIMMNAGIFGLILSLSIIAGHPFTWWLGWLGVITAVGGNILAAFQEDAKKLIAYSSIGIMGYILFALSMNIQMAWMAALYYVVLHFLYKTILFLAVGGVIFRTKTREMYQMGGLIKKMPLSFISVLIGIIALAGIPPLAGFGGKWLFYNAVVMNGWYLQGALVFFSGVVAFLYCFKLISAIFLGQAKDRYRHIKEAPVWYILPQYLLIIGLLIFSVLPELVLQPVAHALRSMPGEGIQWDGHFAQTSFGYWNAFIVMTVIAIMFVILLAWLILNSRKAQKVKQFDMVFAGETPFTPETSHVAYNIYAPFNKALGFLVVPVTTWFWHATASVTDASANHLRKWYNGNGQTYALQMVIYIVMFYLIIRGGF
ncbi:MAG: hypothetical protein J7L89_08020 [Bacteroidales bacterium]|nr:hypothetical protein [Bacteroidales bacterium]